MNHYLEPEIECAPLPELTAALEARLADTDLFVRAGHSALYRDRWLAAGIDPATIKGYTDLQRLPYTNSTDLRLAQERHRPDEFVCSEQHPRLWISTSGSTGAPKWIPVGPHDLESGVKGEYRMCSLGVWPDEQDEVMFILTAPAPFITDTLCWPFLVQQCNGSELGSTMPFEIVPSSFEDATTGIGLALRREATRIAAFPSLVMRIAEGITENAPKAAAARLRQHFSPSNLLGFLISRVRKIRPRDVVKVRAGVFGGEPIAPYRQALIDAWNMKRTYNLYTFSEYGVFLSECSAQDGLHVWLDATLPEIIPLSELERERQEEGYVPLAHPLWQAETGDEGELVITHFGEAFPLVRWRTSDLLQVISTAPCACGRSHPRIRVLQRSDDLVNLGVIRFSIYTLKEKLDALTAPVAIQDWQLRVGRQGYKPLLTLLVRPAGEVDEEAMRAAVKAALHEIELLRQGWQNGLVLEPVVQIVPDLGESLGATGKFRPLVYEDSREGKAA